MVSSSSNVFVSTLGTSWSTHWKYEGSRKGSSSRRKYNASFWDSPDSVESSLHELCFDNDVWVHRFLVDLFLGDDGGVQDGDVVHLLHPRRLLLLLSSSGVWHESLDLRICSTKYESPWHSKSMAVSEEAWLTPVHAPWSRDWSARRCSIMLRVVRLGVFPT